MMTDDSQLINYIVKSTACFHDWIVVPPNKTSFYLILYNDVW